MSRESGHAFLFPGKTEPEGYGLYSYLLFGSKPADRSSRRRYLAVIRALREGIPAISALQALIKDRHQLNVVYVLLGEDTDPSDCPGDPQEASRWIVDRYDYVRARTLLRCVAGQRSYRAGPYFLSYSRPVTQCTGKIQDMHLFQDLSHADPTVANMWVRQFVNQAAKVDYWKADAIDPWVVQLRNAIAIAARGVEPVEGAYERVLELAKKGINVFRGESG